MRKWDSDLLDIVEYVKCFQCKFREMISSIFPYKKVWFLFIGIIKNLEFEEKKMPPFCRRNIICIILMVNGNWNKLPCLAQIGKEDTSTKQPDKAYNQV